MMRRRLVGAHRVARVITNRKSPVRFLTVSICHVEVPAVSASDLSLPPARENSETVAARIAHAPRLAA